MGGDIIKPYNECREKKKTSTAMIRCIYDSVNSFVDNEYAAMNKKVDRLEIAMFSKDDQNEFEVPGLMFIAQRANIFLNIACKIWRVVFVGIILAALGGIVSIVNFFRTLNIF